MTESVGSSAHMQFERDMADLTDQQLAIGLERTKTFTGFFTTPAFRELCALKPEDFGLPDAHKAYIEAATADGQRDRARWSHAAVYHAARETGWFELRTGTEREVYPLFRRNYEAMCARVMAGEQLELPVQRALPPSVEPRPLPAVEAKRRCAGLRALLEA